MSATTVVEASVRTRVSPVTPRRLLIGAAAALAINMAAFGVGTAAGASWDVGQPSPVNLVAVMAATLVSFAVAGGITWALARTWPAFARFAAWAGLAFGVLSLFGVLNAADAATGASLAVMHLATAGAWFLAVRPGAQA